MLLLIWCFFIIQPFLLIILWAVILGVALFPTYKSIIDKIGNKRKKLVTLLFGIVVSLLLLVPAYYITKSLGQTTFKAINDIRNNSLELPAPDESVREWPMIGSEIYDNWSKASTDLKKYSIEHKDFILGQSTNLLTGFKGFLATFITFLLAFILSLIFMYHSDNANKRAHQFFRKLIGPDGDEIINISRDVIRSVVKGILLVAIIQAGLAFIGFKAIGLPGAGIFTFLLLVLAIMQIPTILVMIPAIILAFSISDTTPAVIFTIYCILVGVSDNILKPIFLGKGLQTPMIVILIGTIGGMLLHGIIGLFIGAVVLSVMYKIYQYWVNENKIE